MSQLDYKTWRKFKDEFYNHQIELCDMENKFKDKIYQAKLAEMRLHRKMFEHLITKTHHMMKDICGDNMNFDFCPNYSAERIISKNDYRYGVPSFYNSGILLNKKDIESNKVDFMAFWITKAENWDEEEIWWDVEIELSQFKPIKMINNEDDAIPIVASHNDFLKAMLDMNQTMWKKLYFDVNRKSVTEQIDFRFIVEDEGDEYRGDKELEDTLKQLYSRYKSEKFDESSCRFKLSYEK